MAPRLQVYSCYLLRSLNENFRGSTYIGYTVDPARRIRQHNGELTAGARRTRLRRPWEMATLVMGFPTEVSALQFEWAWQNPKKSKIIKDYTKDFWNQRGLAPKLNILHIMLGLEPWKSLPLRLHFTSQNYLNVAEASIIPLPPHLLTSATVGPLSEMWMYTEAERLLKLAREYRKNKRKCGDGNDSGVGNADSNVDPLDETMLLRNMRGKSVRRILQRTRKSSSSFSEPEVISDSNSIQRETCGAPFSDSEDQPSMMRTVLGPRNDINLPQFHQYGAIRTVNSDVTNALEFAKRSCGIDIMKSHQFNDFMTFGVSDASAFRGEEIEFADNNTLWEPSSYNRWMLVVDSGSDNEISVLNTDHSSVDLIELEASTMSNTSLKLHDNETAHTDYCLDPNIEAKLNLSDPVLDLTLDATSDFEVEFRDRPKLDHLVDSLHSLRTLPTKDACPWCMHAVNGSKSVLSCPLCGQSGHLLCWSGHVLRKEESPLSEIKLTPDPDTLLSCPSGDCDHQSSWRELLISNRTSLIELQE